MDNKVLSSGNFRRLLKLLTSFLVDEIVPLFCQKQDRIPREKTGGGGIYSLVNQESNARRDVVGRLTRKASEFKKR